METTSSHEWVITQSAHPIHIWNLYPNEQAAKSDFEKVNSANPNYDTVISFDDYQALKEVFMLGKGIYPITEELYQQALEVLPPLNWHTTAEGLHVFFMSEFSSIPYTEQYILFQGNYYAKTVNYRKPETWATLQEIKTLI